MEFRRPLHVGAPNIGNRDVFQAHIDSMFECRWLANHGELVLRFEDELKAYLGVRHCIAMCNGTTALEIAIRALGLTGEVVVPSLTFVATAHALRWQGITPVFCDVDPSTLCLDPAEVEKRITPRTTGIIGVHLFGRGCDVEALRPIADAHGLKLMFDAAHAFGNTIGGRSIGGFGECEAFSFHATKFFNSFEGGAIATNNDALAARIRLMQNFGFSDWDTVDHVGINGKMTEVCAAMGLANLQSIDRFREANRRNRAAYAAGFKNIPGLRLVGEPAAADRAAANNQYVVVEVSGEYPLPRDELMRRLQAENVLARRYFWPGCHRMEPYRTDDPEIGGELPVTEAFLEKVLLFPTGTAVSVPAIGKIMALVEGWVAGERANGL